jgi:hypothetical protein
MLIVTVLSVAFFIVMLIVVMLNLVMLSGIMLSAVEPANVWSSEPLATDSHCFQIYSIIT